jgi:ABC-2 type transport system ATP-binding protein
MAQRAVPVFAEGLTRIFRSPGKRGTVRAVDGVSLTVSEGEVLGLLGPNGSGKSTTMKMLLGLLRPTDGRAVVFGKPAGNRDALRRIGYLPEVSRLFPHLTGKETLRFFGALAGLPRRVRNERADALVAEVGLGDAATRRTAGYSKGMGRRLSLAAALIGDPDLLILDEPTSGLDPLASAEMKEKILGLKGAGKTVLFSSHLLADVSEVCDRIVVLGGGKVVREGEPAELLRLKDEFDLRYRSDEPGFADKVREFVAAGGAEVVALEPATGDLADLFARIFSER